jgi:hypothetical protein
MQQYAEAISKALLLTVNTMLITLVNKLTINKMLTRWALANLNRATALHFSESSGFCLQ